MRLHPNLVLPFLAGVCAATLALGQERPIQMKLFGSAQTLLSQERIDSGSGYGGGGQISYRLLPRLRGQLTVQYDVMGLEQPWVLDEWNWDYWQTTYIPFLPGAQLAEINHTLRYTSTDSIYSGRFVPSQSMKELRIGWGFCYEMPLSAKLMPYIALDGGLSLFRRELQMQEHWIKRFKLDTLSTAPFDYEYKLDVLHFAPPKKGKRLYIQPSLGMRFAASSSIDLDLAGHYVCYPGRDAIAWLENLFNISSDSQMWFPLKSKALVTLGLTFKY